MLAELRRLVAGRPAPAGTEQRIAALPTTEHGLPLPFVCQRSDGSGTVHDVRRARVTQCALSRICALCGDSLDEPPLVLVGPAAEAASAAFSLPPFHAGCAAWVQDLRAQVHGTLLGHPEQAGAWERVETGGFSLLRPSTREPEERTWFLPTGAEAH